MKLNKAAWERAKQILRVEVAAYKVETNAKFGDNEISWEFPRSYPPGSYRLMFRWANGMLSGERTRHWAEISGGNITLDDAYLEENFKRFRNPSVKPNLVFSHS